MTTALVLASLAQTQRDIPTQVVPSVPTFVHTVPADANAKDFQPATTQLHTVTVTLSKETATIETVTLFRNPNATALMGTLRMPFFSHGFSPRATGEITATWNKGPMTGGRRVNDTTLVMPGKTDAVVPTQGAVYEWPGAIPAKGTGTLRTSFQIPLAKVALGQTARQFALHIPPMSAPTEQLQVAIKFSPEIVFGVLNSQGPFGTFQTGPNGSFAKWDGKTATKEGYVLFRFYPNEVGG
ncbi:MAG: hypothetical protein LCH41_04740 [Armatimonadetes bacterium]|nr:hypothetical protein [Armatimonadota bacterium]